MAMTVMKNASLGEILGLSPSSASRLRNGERRNPSLATLVTISETFSVPLDDLAVAALDLKEDRPEKWLAIMKQIESVEETVPADVGP